MNIQRHSAGCAFALWSLLLPAALFAAQQTSIRAGQRATVIAPYENPEEIVSLTLQRDGAFVGASSTNWMDIRETATGSVTLTVERRSATGALQSQHLTMNIGTTAVSLPVLSDDPASLLSSVGISGELQESTLVLVGDEPLILEPKSGTLEQLFLDLDTSMDTSGDGDAGNDNVLAGTSLKTAQGLGMLVLPPREGITTALLAGKLRTGKILSQTLTIVRKPATENGSSGGDRGIAVEAQSGRTLSVRVDPLLLQGEEPLIPLWDFGDGQRGARMVATHTYARDGAYTVRLRLVRLSDGTTLQNYERSFTMAAGIEQGGSSSSATQMSSTEQQPSTGSAGGSWVWTVLIALGVLIVSMVVGAGGVLLLKKMRGGGLQKTLDAVEKKLVPESASEQPATLTVTPVTPAAEPQAAETVVPPWLAGTSAEPAAPVAAPQTPGQSAPAPAQPEPLSPESTAAAAELPPWLAEAQGIPQAEPTPAPAPEPVPAPTPEPAPVVDEPLPEPQPLPAPVQEPVATPAPEPAVVEPAVQASPDVPPWLEAAAPETVEPVTPAPVAATPVPVAPAPATPPPAAAAPAPAKLARPTNPEQEERERERKRLKRQRYRQNKRERERTEKAATSPQPAPQEPVAPEPKPEVPAVVGDLPAVIEPAALPAVVEEPAVPAVIEAPDIPATVPAPSPVVASEQLPESDDAVQFIVRADSVSTDSEEPPTKPL